MQIKPEQNNVFLFPCLSTTWDDPQHSWSSSGKINLKVYPKKPKNLVLLTSGRSLPYSHLQMPEM